MGLLDGKVAIITGAGTGIGRGIAKAYSREGAKIVLASRNRVNLERTAQELRADGGTALVLPTDVTIEEQVIDMVRKTVDEYGRLDIMVSNSGIFDGGPFEELTLETWRKVIDVNLTGVFLCGREAMKVMRRQGEGRIINIGSISAQMPRAGSAPYTATKHALVGLTKTMALEGREFGVVTSILHPGNVDKESRVGSTDPADHEPMMQPEDIAAAALTMAALPPNVNMLESIVLPTAQLYLGRG